MAFVKIEFLFIFWIFFAYYLIHNCGNVWKISSISFNINIKVQNWDKTGIIFAFQWNSHHHFFNLFKYSYVLSKNLGYEWNVKRDEDCWYICGGKGGSCSACKLNDDDGYCCSQTKLDLNGDCPTEAVDAIISSSDSVIEMHQCVRKINSGKWILSTIHRNSNSNNIKYNIRKVLR